MEAKEVFLVNAELVVLTDGWEEWPKVVLRLGVKTLVVAELLESMEAEESPLLWEKKLRSPNPVEMVGESQPELAPPNPPPKPKPPPERPKGVDVDPVLPSSKSCDCKQINRG